MDTSKQGSIKRSYQLMLELILRRKAGRFDSKYFVPSLLELVECVDCCDKKRLRLLCQALDYGYLNLELYAPTQEVQLYWQKKINSNLDEFARLIKSRLCCCERFILPRK